MQATQAWEMLHNPSHCSRLNTVQLYELMLRAGYSKEVAQEAANQRAHDRLDANKEI